MKLKKLGIIAACGALVASLALAGCSSQSSSSSASSSAASSSSSAAAAATDEIALIEDGKLTVVGSYDFPPFENLEGDEPVGFEVDLVKAIGDKMGLEVVYLPTMKFDALVPLIAAGGKADIAASGITITDDRAVQIDFTEAIMDSNQGIVVMKDSGIESVEQLTGKKIGAQTGTTGFDWAAENIEGAEIVAFDEMTAVFAALQAGQIDAIAADLPVVQYYVLNAYQDAEIIVEIPTGEQYAIIVNQENPALTEAIDAAIAELKADGTYTTIYEQWFGVAPSSAQ